jgi:hypothetical protein
MNVWGITGTNGKTTTTWVLSEFLMAAGRRCGYVTTVEVYTGGRRFSTGYTTPPLDVLKSIFAEMEGNGITDCVMEVSSHAIHQRRFGDTVFSGGAFTNLTEDHLDYHKTMDAYFDVKLDFARIIASQSVSDPSSGRRDLPPYAVCLDGGMGVEMYDATGVLPLNVLPVTAGRPGFDLSELTLAGDYNRSNVLLAAALAEARKHLKKLVRINDSRWHITARLVCRISEHHPLVACSLLLLRLAIYATSNIRRLTMNVIFILKCTRGKLLFRNRVADFRNDLASYRFSIDILKALASNLAHINDNIRPDHRLASNMCRRVLLKASVKNRIGNTIRHFVGMSL